MIRLRRADRLDVLWNGRPTRSLDLAPGEEVRVPLPGEGRIGLRGCAEGVLMSARNLDIVVT